MDVGLLNRWLNAPGPAGPHGRRDKVLLAVMAVAAATPDGGLTQARVLSMRVEEAPHILGGTPFAAKVVGAVRALAKAMGLAPTDPVFASRKRDADGRRRPVSRVQAYRVLRTRAGTGWQGCILRLVSGRPARPVRTVPTQPVTRRPTPTPTDDLMARLEGRPRPTHRPLPDYDEDRGEQEPDPDDRGEQSADW